MSDCAIRMCSNNCHAVCGAPGAFTPRKREGKSATDRVEIGVRIASPQKIEKMLAQSVGFSHALGEHKGTPDFNTLAEIGLWIKSSFMARSADVVIIGAGIVGSSIAFHLTEAGCKNVLVIERETRQGLGSTGKSMGGVRAQFATDVNIRMSLYSIPFLARFEEATGHPSGYKPHGYLFMATNDWHMNYLRNNSARQKALGLKNVELLAPDDIRKVLPQLRSDDIVGGSLCSTDGFVDPDSVMTGFMARAIDRGAELWRGTEVTGIYTDHATVSGVLTSQGRQCLPPWW